MVRGGFLNTGPEVVPILSNLEIETAYEEGYVVGLSAKNDGRAIPVLHKQYASNGTNEGAERAYKLGELWLRGLQDGYAGRDRNPYGQDGGKRRKSRKSRKSKKSRKSRR